MASQGANFPASGVDGGTNGGANAWTNPGNVTANDTNFATASSGTQPTNFLNATQFGFSIPSGATINGIQVEVSCKINTSTGNLNANHKMLKAGTKVGTAQTFSPASYGTTETLCSAGGASNLWGTTWSDTDINDTGFGFAFTSSKTGKGAKTISLNFVRITVTYTVAGNVFTQTRRYIEAVNRASTY